MLGVSGGFYPTAGNPNNMARATLFLVYATPLFPLRPGGYSNLELDMCQYGLMGFVDESLWSWYEVKFGFKTIQEALSTSKTLEEAIETFAKYAGPDAARQVVHGIIASGKMVKAEYGQELWDKFAELFKKGLNPFTNPFLGPWLNAALWLGGIYLAIQVVGLAKKQTQVKE